LIKEFANGREAYGNRTGDVLFDLGRVADEQKPDTAERRMQARFPQPVRVADLIGMPVLDDSASTLGHVREVVRTKQDRIELIVAYGGFLGLGHPPSRGSTRCRWDRGQHLSSLDMPRSEYAAASTWAPTLPDAGAQLPADATIKVALSRH
jgi:PRC-barrel domain